MFDRVYIKVLAKNRLKVGQGGAILAAFILAIITGVNSGDNGFRVTLRLNGSGSDGGAASVLFPIFAMLAIIGLALTIFIGNIIQVGGSGWFLRFWRGENVPVGEVFASFRIYVPCLKTTLLRDVLVFLWSLLFIIPGIVMGLAYSMADYIIYENPNLPARRALDMSRAMTQGYKGEIFIFGLSFLGWQLLSMITCGILGIVYVNPYYYTAQAGMYEALKSIAIQKGVLTWADFGQYPPVYQAPPPPPVPPYGPAY